MRLPADAIAVGDGRIHRVPAFMIAAVMSFWISMIVCFVLRPISWRHGGISDWGDSPATLVPYAAGLLGSAIFMVFAFRSLPASLSWLGISRRLLRVCAVLLVGVVLTPPVVWGHAVGLLHLVISSTLFIAELALALLVCRVTGSAWPASVAAALQVFGCLITLLSLRHVFEALLVGEVIAQFGFGIVLIASGRRLAEEFQRSLVMGRAP
jgi:hypothetical protein